MHSKYYHLKLQNWVPKCHFYSLHLHQNLFQWEFGRFPPILWMNERVARENGNWLRFFIFTILWLMYAKRKEVRTIFSTDLINLKVLTIYHVQKLNFYLFLQHPSIVFHRTLPQPQYRNHFEWVPLQLCRILERHTWSFQNSLSINITHLSNGYLYQELSSLLHHYACSKYSRERHFQPEAAQQPHVLRH